MSITPQGRRAQMRAMLELQDEMNRRVDADWRRRGRAWYRAIWIECAELLEHYGGWKWWKAADEPDPEQVLLEVVDIWHFGLSLELERAVTLDGAAERLAAGWERGYRLPGGFHEGVETLALAALGERRFAVEVVPGLLAEIDRDLDDLYRTYVGKNVLNIFRQDHGYREGRYVKEWAGREDNEHLAEIAAALDAGDAAFRGRLYEELDSIYRDLTGDGGSAGERG